jgi:organic hydroperoxide reductase OsmC/OhrA
MEFEKIWQLTSHTRQDGLLDMKLALPRQLGGRRDATNPEQLFASGYAACFENALLRVSRDTGLRLRTKTSKSLLKLVSVHTTKEHYE